MSLTVQQVIETLILPAGRREHTVDTFKSGKSDAAVRKVAVVFTATYAVIRQAVESGVDLIVTHEPTYYNHLDEQEWLSGNPVFERKRELIERSGIAIFRLHDYIHAYKPDGILIGMLRALEWEAYAAPEELRLLTFPQEEGMTLSRVADHLKRKLGIESMLAAGDPELPVSRVGLMPGAVGGRAQLQYLGTRDIDLLIVGETNEWETNEFARDAHDMGLAKGLIVMGHQKSEEAGMRTVVDQLRAAHPELSVEFLPSPTAVRRI